VRALERRYGRLLRAHPASYRRERGNEILSTVLEAASAGQGRPSLRDARALVMGGLRVRAAQNHRLGTATNLRLAALLGVALWLALNCALGISRSFSPSGQAATGQPGYQWLVWPLVLVAVVLVWFAPRAVALAVPLVAAAASVVAWPPSQKLLEFALALLARCSLARPGTAATIVAVVARSLRGVGGAPLRNLVRESASPRGRMGSTDLRRPNRARAVDRRRRSAGDCTRRCHRAPRSARARKRWRPPLG
jgi:hypothetical protein